MTHIFLIQQYLHLKLLIMRGGKEGVLTRGKPLPQSIGFIGSKLHLLPIVADSHAALAAFLKRFHSSPRSLQCTALASISSYCKEYLINRGKATCGRSQSGHYHSFCNETRNLV